MPTYFILETSTDQGRTTVAGGPGRAAHVVEAAAKYGVTLHEWFYTLGPFDFLMKVEADDDSAVGAFAIGIQRGGNVTVQIVHAFSPAQWGQMVEQVVEVQGA